MEVQWFGKHNKNKVKFKRMKKNENEIEDNQNL